MSETKSIIYNDIEVGTVTYDRIDHGFGQVTYDATIDWKDPHYEVEIDLLKDAIGGDFDDRRLHNLTINTVSRVGVMPLSFEYLEKVQINCSSYDDVTQEPAINIDSFSTLGNIKELEINGGTLEQTQRDPKYKYGITYNGMKLPKEILENRFDGTSIDMRAKVYQAMLDRNIQPSMYNLMQFMKMTHDGHFGRATFPEAALNEFKQSGFNLSFVEGTKAEDRQYFEDYKAELEAIFKEKMAGNVPRIIDTLVSIGITYRLDPKDIFESFDINRTRDYLKAGISPVTGATLAVLLDKNTFDRAIKQENVELYVALADKYYRSGNNMYLDQISFLVKHPHLNQKVLADLIKYQDFIYVGPNDSTEKLRSEISRAGSNSEIARIEKAYPNFKFSDCQFNLKFNDIEQGNLHAGIMRPGDYRMATIGYDTHCCQHLGGAGETAMMYGLIYDKAGFFAIEDKDTNKILAQAEIWELDDDTLIFDNIEFDNDRDVSQFAKIIGDWAKGSGYDNIYMGNGYNTLATKDGITKREGVTPPIDKKVKDILQNRGVYTDASAGCSVIKKDGEIEPYFTQDHSERLMQRVQRDAMGHELSYAGYREQHSHLECYSMMDDIVDAMASDLGVGEDRINDIIYDGVQELVDEKSDVELMQAVLGEGGDTAQKILNTCSYIEGRERIENLDRDDVFKDCLIEAYKKDIGNRHATTIPKALMEAIDEADIDPTADIFDTLEELKEGIDMDGETVPIEWNSNEDIWIDGGDTFEEIMDNIESSIYENEGMIYYSEGAEYIVDHYNEVADEMREYDLDEYEVLDEGRELIRDEIQEHVNYQTEYLKNAVLINTYESIVQKMEPQFYKTLAYGNPAEDVGISECDRDKLLEILKDNLDQCLAGKPQISYSYDPDVLDNADFYDKLPIDVSIYTPSGAAITAHTEYEFGEPLEDISRQVIAYLDQSPERLFEELAQGQNYTQEEKDMFIQNLSETINHYSPKLDPDGSLLADIRANAPAIDIDNILAPEPEIIKAIEDYQQLMSDYEAKGLSETVFQMQQNMGYAGLHIEDGKFMIEDPKGTLVEAKDYTHQESFIATLNSLKDQCKDMADKEMAKPKEIEQPKEQEQTQTKKRDLGRDDR